jgi:hypothetical protein
MNKTGRAQRAKEVVEERIPDLHLGPRTTESPAIRDLTFKGPLKLWDTFHREVLATHQQWPWRKSSASLTHRPLGPRNAFNLANEHVLVGDEHGVQGRF